MVDPSEKRKAPRINVNWPITIITSQGTIEGESRNITPSGIFIHCKKKLPEDEVYQMIIKLPNGKQIIVRGQMMWSNLNGRDDTGSLVDMGFSFIKMSDEDQKVLRTVISVFGEGGERKPKGG
ncbi:MAG: PilZ domain-containing protein [Deltaproteobacteria bacterium]|nr:PilZ domain-containing protein [Deltaproteobacteria bacterium]